jgi:hypothetical protein
MPEPVPYGVYISGPMQGVPEFNYPLFNRVAQRIAFTQEPNPGKPAKGTEWAVVPINPAANFKGATDLSREVYLELALRQVDEAKAIVLLPNWHQSPGARLELARAMHNGLDVYYWHEDDEFPDEYEFVLCSHEALREIMAKTAQPVSEDRAQRDQHEYEGELVEEEAARLVRNGERQKNYGHPRGDFDKIAQGWTAIFGVTVTAEQVALAMVWLKMARLLSNPAHHDSLVDLIGYGICYDRLSEPQDNMEAINAERVRRGLLAYKLANGGQEAA